MAGKELRWAIIILAVLLLGAMAGCSFFKKDALVKGTPDGLYARGSAEFQDGNYKKAREYFTRLKDEYPLHELAILAELGIADSFYTDKEYADAVNSYSDFLNMHPTNENIPYVIYQIGRCHYSQKGTIDRDQTETIKARKEFERLIARFPDSKFSIAAGKLLRECKQELAEQEFYVGRFYFRQKKYAAALRRFETIERDYSNIGLDYKLEFYMTETKKRISEEKAKENLEEKKKAASSK
jgi:outer membrane protein assembly factor BamD